MFFCLSVCLSACLSACITQKPRRRTSPNFLCMLPVAVAWFSYSVVATCSVLPVLWTTSRFHIIALSCVLLSGDGMATSVTAEIPTEFCSTIKTSKYSSRFAMFDMYDCAVVACMLARGCADIRAPENGWVRRVGDRVTVTCNFTAHTWHLVCKDTHWVGQISACDRGTLHCY